MRLPRVLPISIVLFSSRVLLAQVEPVPVRPPPVVVPGPVQIVTPPTINTPNPVQIAPVLSPLQTPNWQTPNWRATP